MNRIFVSLPMVMLCASVALSPATAEELAWRHDYNAARREASQHNRLIVLDFGTENCTWCRKLDATTFQDPAVVKLLAERCIPVKIDAGKAAQLAQALNVQSYPTLVFGHPDGRVLATHVGYMDSAAFQEQLQRALKEVSPTARSVVATPSPVIVPVSLRQDSGPSASNRDRRAKELLAQAQEDYRQQLYVGCLERCKRLTDAYSDLPESGDARKLAARIKGDPEQFRSATEFLTDTFGDLYLAGAESWIRDNQPDKATPFLERILQVSPGTRFATLALKYLEQLQKADTTPTAAK